MAVKKRITRKQKQACGINAVRAGLSLGLLFAIFQIAWGILLLATGGSAAGHMYRMGMLSTGGVAYAGFELVTYVAGVVVCYALGFVCGWLFAQIWNSLKD